MATTGTNVFTVTRDDVIKAALRVLQVIGAGETPINEDYTNCTQALNIMIKGWSSNDRPVWVMQNIEIPTVTGVVQYYIGPTGGRVGRVTITDGGTGHDATGTWTSTGGTTGTTAAGTYTATSGVIDSVTVTTAGDTYTTATGFTATFSGSGTGETVVAEIAGLTTSRPLAAISAFQRDSSGNDTPLYMTSRQEYDDLNDKDSSGKPNQFYYDRQEANGILYVFSAPDNSTDTIHLRIQRQFYDMTDSTDNFDFPEEFFLALKWGLAAELYLEYPVPESIIQIIEMKAEKFVRDAFDGSVEEASVYFTANSRG